MQSIAVTGPSRFFQPTILLALALMALAVLLAQASGLALGVPLMAMYTDGMPSKELIEL